MKITPEQAMKVTRFALQRVADIGDCLFCELAGTDVHAWHEEACPLHDIDENFPPQRATPKRSAAR